MMIKKAFQIEPSKPYSAYIPLWLRKLLDSLELLIIDLLNTVFSHVETCCFGYWLPKQFSSFRQIHKYIIKKKKIH